MFKKPSSKSLMQVGKGFLAFEGGKRIGRGIAGAVPAKDESQTQLIKGVLVGASILVAASYTGKNTDMVIPALVGVAAEQAGDIIDAQAKKIMTKKANPGMPEKFLEDAMGLGCPGNGGSLAAHSYPSLGNPTIQEIEWDSVWDGTPQISETAGA